MYNLSTIEVLTIANLVVILSGTGLTRTFNSRTLNLIFL